MSKHDLLEFERCRCTCHKRGEAQGVFPHSIPCCVVCPHEGCGLLVSVSHYYSHMQYHGEKSPTFPPTASPIIEPDLQPQHG